MIERKILKAKFLEYSISEFLKKELNDVPVQKIIMEKTPIGEKITIYTSAPGLVIGRQGSNIKKLTIALKDKFKFENPQIKIGEVENINLSAALVAKNIANSLEKFGSQKFKLSGFKALSGIMNAGAMGVEIKISGKLPSSRSKSWRFAKGYLKKTGYVSDFLIDKAIEHVTLKTGVVGIQVQIMLNDTPLPDKIDYIEEVNTSEVIESIIDDKKQDSVEVVEEVIEE